MSTPDSFGSPDGRTYSTPETAGQAATPGRADERHPREALADMLWRHRKALGDEQAYILELADAYAADERREGAADAQAAIAAAAPATAVAAVLKLHQPEDDVIYASCAAHVITGPSGRDPQRFDKMAECPDCQRRTVQTCSHCEHIDEWPCPTVQAIGEAAKQEPQPQAAPKPDAAVLETELRDIITEAARCRSTKQPCPFCERLIARAMKATGAGQPGTEGQ